MCPRNENCIFTLFVLAALRSVLSIVYSCFDSFMISNFIDHDADFQFIIIIIIILFCPNLSMVNHGSRTSEYSRITIEVLERDINAHSNDPIEDRGFIYQSAFDSYTEEQQKSTNAVNITAATATRDERVVSKRDIVDRLETKQKVCFYIAYQKVSSKNSSENLHFRR